MKSRKNGIIFDLDGTLWNVVEQVTAINNSILPDDAKVTPDQVRGTMGKTAKEIAPILFPNYSRKEADELLKKCDALQIEGLKKSGGTLYDGVLETLPLLKETYDLYIVSNCQAGYIEAFLDAHKLREYFADFESHGNTGLPKSKNIRMIIRRNIIKNAVYVGDTQKDCVAANVNKIPFIFAAYGFGTVSSCDYTLRHFANISTGLIDIAKSIENKILGQRKRKADKEKEKRKNATPEQRAKRAEAVRNKRKARTPDEEAADNKNRARWRRARIARMTEQEKEEYDKKEDERIEAYFARMTPEGRTAYNKNKAKNLRNSRRRKKQKAELNAKVLNLDKILEDKTSEDVARIKNKTAKFLNWAKKNGKTL